MSQYQESEPGPLWWLCLSGVLALSLVVSLAFAIAILMQFR